MHAVVSLPVDLRIHLFKKCGGIIAGKIIKGARRFAGRIQNSCCYFGSLAARVVRVAMAWRIRWLCAYAMSASKAMAGREARVGHSTADYHLKNDPDFAAQADSAKEHTDDLLHIRCMQRCIEGDIEPVYWQGEVVGHVRKFDSRLQIEMLRAHMPDKFKTPGSGQRTSTQATRFLCSPRKCGRS